MNSTDNQQLLADKRPLLGDSQHAPAGKKLYRRPSVQVYGTLSQITQGVANPVTHVLADGATGGSPSGQQQNNRT